MSSAASPSLQQAVYQHLAADTAVIALVGADIYDALPVGTPPALYISLGPEIVLDASSQSGPGARHDFVISVIADTSGFHEAKSVAAAICDALVDAPLLLSRGVLVGLWFLKAKAARSGRGDVRRIDLTFRVRVDGL